MHSVRRHGSATDFLAVAESLLLPREAEYNLLLGIGHALSEQERSGKQPIMSREIDPVAHLMTVERAGTVVGCALRTPPYRLVISHAPDGALHALADHLAEVDPVLPGVHGPTGTSATFADRWSERTATSVRPIRSMGILQLDRVEWPRAPGGRLRTARVDDVPTLAAWIGSFGEEIGEPQDGEALARARVDEGSLYLWDRQGPRSIAATARRSRSGCSVNLVYTPPQHRGRGYASACVAALSDRILKLGFNHCSLYTDAANPTANRIYRAIGYRPVGSAQEFVFER